MTLRHARLGWIGGWFIVAALLTLPVRAAGSPPAALEAPAQPRHEKTPGRRRGIQAPDVHNKTQPKASPADQPAAGSDAAPDAAEHDRQTLELLKVFVDSLDQIERNYVKPVDRRELMEAAINGMLSKLDPYSSYIEPSDVERFRTSVESQFGGIGIQVNMENGVLKIVTPLVGTPAYRAGLMAGDTIVEIEGKPVAGIQLDEAVRRMKGPVGTKVNLTVQHADKPDKQTVTLTREIVHVETVLGDHRAKSDQWDFMLDRQKRVGYIRVTSFGRDTVRDLRRALDHLQQDQVRGLVLDLRFNPGGLLTSAIETCDLFIDKGRIVSTKGRNVKERTWDATAQGTYGGFAMAILVNHYGASASEIVSACLQDHGRAVVVGQRSWGKGSVQNVIDLEDGKSVLKLTTASYWRPSGKNIHRFPDAKEDDDWGVRPDKNYDVALTPDEMRQLVENWRERDIVRPHKMAPKADSKQAPAEKPKETSTGKPTEVSPPPKAATPFVDKQLQRALEYLNVELAKAS